jgi:RND superfamily putative drug exporter
MRRPWLVVVVVTGVMLTLASPARNLALEAGDASVFPLRTEPRQVADAITNPVRFDTSQLFAIEIVAEATEPSPDLGADLAHEIEALHGVEGVDRVVVDELAYLRVRHGFVPGGSGARDLVSEIHERVPLGLVVHATGIDATGHELHEHLRQVAPFALATILGVAFIALLVAFRSIVLPIKAFLMNLLSVGAGYGALVFVFQEGHLERLLGHDTPGALDPSIVAVIFAITFGLSLDYEVFILSRMKEEWEATGDNRLAVARGLARTGRLVTGAALLLVAVIVGFLAGEMVFIAELGVGLGVAILLDATLVRALLLPATMELLGSANWWFPGKRTRRHVGVERIDA